ncbi:MAG: hypothetical protein WC595_04750 [Candidatus Nanoarchaeia archaeon]
MKQWKYTKNIEKPLQEEPSFFKNKKNVIIISLFIIVLMVGSVLTLFESSDENNLDYNGHSFLLTATGWATSIGGQQASFEQSPQELENIPVEPFTLPSKIYLTFDPKDTTEQAYEIQRLKAFLSITGTTLTPACTTLEGCSDIPIITCNQDEPALYLKYGTESRIYKDNNCIVLQTDADPTRVVNRVIYKALGIMP